MTNVQPEGSASAEVAEEISNEEHREKAWNRFKSFIDPQRENIIFSNSQFLFALQIFITAHLDVLIDQYDPEIELQPYEYIREEMLQLSRRGLAAELASSYFHQIRTMLTNNAAMKVTRGAESTKIANENQNLKFAQAGRGYVTLLRQRITNIDVLGYSERNLAHALANRLIFQGSHAQLCADPYQALNDTFENILDEDEKEIAVARIANMVTMILIAAVADRTEKRPRKPLPERVVSPTPTPPSPLPSCPPPSVSPIADVEQKVLVQRIGYCVCLSENRLKPGDIVVRPMDPSTERSVDS
jgi:hypothetical protein